MLSSCGGMAELVDALDSKSCGLRPCQFESDYPYHLENFGESRSFFISVNVKSPAAIKES